MIIKDTKLYDGSLIYKRFAYKYFRNHTLPIGSISHKYLICVDHSLKNTIQS